jgi:hypothetical protein
MKLLGWLRRRDLDPSEYVTRAEFEALEKSVQELDRVQLEREIELTGLRDQLKRQLGRLSAFKQRDEQREEGGNEATTLRELLRSKYPRISNGGGE